MEIKVFIQARMSSSRFPGKVLAPVNGIPMIARVVDGSAQVLGKEAVVVVTSSEPSDDPLALYVQSLGVKVFRGPLEDVFGRIRLCLESNPCTWFFRISADSPLINCSILRAMTSYVDQHLDLITNVQKRTFPHGHSAELIRAESFSHIDASCLSTEDREHVTTHFYSHPDAFRILNMENLDSTYGAMNFVVDTLDDLRRVSALEPDVKYDFLPQVKVTVQ